jgi:CubicO group peptidase (beta-lactamase class C family)
MGETAMKRLLLVAMILLIGCGSSLSAGQENNSRIERVENGLRPYGWALFGDEEHFNIPERMKFYKVPGVSIAVIENGKLVWAKGYGVKDFDTKEPVTVNTLFQAASISKPLNDTAIMKLVEQGRLALNEDVNKYLKSWKVPSNEFTEKEKVTVSRLMKHTAGIINFRDLTGYWGYRTTDPLPTIQQMVRGEPPAKTPPLVVERTPGEAFSYSNGGTMILQFLLMEMENKPYQQIMKEMVLDPLGMSNSIFAQPLPDSLKDASASAHVYDWKPLEGRCMVYPELAAAGLWTTPTDLAKFIIEHWLSLNGKSNKIISRETAERMITLTVEGSDYSEGFEITRKGDEVYFGHRGGNAGFYSNMIINRSSGSGAIVMVNGGGDAISSNLKREILLSIATEYGWKDYLPSTMRTVSLAPDQMKRFTGRFYVSEDNVVEIKEVDGRPAVENPDRGSIGVFAISGEELVAKSILPLRYRLVKAGNIEGDTLMITSGNNVSRAHRMSDDQMVPCEYLASGNIEKAIELYRGLKRDIPSSPDLRESRINRIGYVLLGKNKMAEAIAILALNTEWYPESWNTFDSLGEAYAKAGNGELAIENYEKALKLNPNSASAMDALRQLRENR